MEPEGCPFSDWQPHEKKVVLKLTLVRHGETVANRDRIVQGQTPGELTGFGREQARRLGKRLAKQRWDAFYCSDLARTQQTAQELLVGAGADVTSIMADSGQMTYPLEAKETSQVGLGPNADQVKGNFPKMVLLKLLRERSAGELEGGPTGCVDAAAKASGVPSRCFRPKDGESWEDVQARADQFLRWLVNIHIQTAPLHKSEVNQRGPVDGIAGAFKPTADTKNSQGAIDKAFPPEPEAGIGLPERFEPPSGSGSLMAGAQNAELLPRNVPQGEDVAPQNQMRRSGSFSSRLRGIKRVPSSELQGLGAAPGGRMLRSGSFTGEPRAASKILGIPRSESFGEGGESAPPRVAGVKRAGSFNALAPKVMKRVDSLGLSKLFNEEMQVGAPAGRGADAAVGGGESSTSGFEDELEGAGRRSGRYGGSGGHLREESFMSVWSDSDCGDGEMQVIELGPGGQSWEERTGGVEKAAATGERRPVGSSQAERSWEAGMRKERNGRRSGGHVARSLENEDGQKGRSSDEGPEVCMLTDGGDEPLRPSESETDGKEHPKGRRKGGRPSVKRVLVVTHGGFIKEFVNASMAYSEGPNLSKTRSQTRQSLGWRTLLNSAGLPSHEAPQLLHGMNRPPGGISLQGPVQIQRTFGHNDFVSFRAVNETGRCENLVGQGQTPFENAREPSCDSAAETLTPKRLCFAQHDVVGPVSPDSTAESGIAPDEVGGISRNGESRATGAAAIGGGNGTRGRADERARAAPVYPGRPRNTSVYEFEIKRLEGRRGTPRFTVKMIRENDVYHLDGLVVTRTFQSPRTTQKAEEKVVWQSPLAKLLDQ